MDVDLVCWSHLRWSFVFQRPQHLMQRWARGRRVFFIEEPIEGGASRLEVREEECGVVVVVPCLPRGLPPGERTLELQRLVGALYVERAIVEPICWFYSPMFLDVARALPRSLVVYDCMDELSAFTDAPPQLQQTERELLAVADVVLTGGASLYEAKRMLHSHVHALPSSVDVAHFGRARAPQLEPADQAVIPRPRLGFHGVVDERMDIVLLAGLARARPDWHIVIVGPVVKIDPSSLPRLPNIHWLGMKKYDELPGYLSGWDAALLPFALNKSTRFISPTKTPEYLAGGCPVVSTPIADVVRPYGEAGLVRIAGDVDGFVGAIEQALVDDPIERLRAADAFLASMSWEQTFARAHGLVADAARRRRGQPDRTSSCTTS
ncbi:MAG: glycosyltransferase family 1 protein [Deltaproteobacteria bacterium]|nr:glycosyltransferase family 1 protein [Deltaproteobacteria bacterium]